jgi:hypothetical protein
LLRVAVLGLALAGALPATLAAADSFTPVRLTVSIAPVARLHAPLTVKVAVAADAGALDDRSGPLRVQVKLAGECGGVYQYTPGVVLLNKQLSPQPSTGSAYAASVKGSGKPSAYGTETVCVWLNDADGRTWASDQSTQVDVSRACTRAASRYDAARKRRHAKPKTVAADRRAARKACGAGVPL